MSILRGHYLAAWTASIRIPYSTDPFPAARPGAASHSVLAGRSRETALFDRWIAGRIGTELRRVESGGLAIEGDSEEYVFARLQVGGGVASAWMVLTACSCTATSPT